MPTMRFATLVLLSFFHLSSSSIVSPNPRSGLAIPLTKRTQLTDDNGVVDFEVLKSQVAKVKSKMNRGFQAYHKNTGLFHPSDNRQISKRQSGSDALTDDQGQLWQGTISVGTPPVGFTVDFDTGSSDAFLPGSGCTTNCQGHKVYNTDASSTASATGQSFSLAFGDGSTVEGQVFTDTVTIAQLTATNQAVGAATQYSTGFNIDQFPPDGLVGMAFKEISQFGADPVFQTLVSESATSDPRFSFKLASSGSELFLGGVNQNLIGGSITEVPVTQQGFWQVDLDSVNVNGQATASGLSAVIDTGTTVVLGDAASVASIYAAIPGSQDAGNGFFTYPCDANPDISLTFGGQAFTISPDTFNLGPASQGSSDCVGGISVIDGEQFWIVGDVFLQNVYTVFDVGGPGVGFANLA